MVANDRKISATSTNEVPLKPQTTKMLSLSIGACNWNNPDNGLVARAATQTGYDVTWNCRQRLRAETEAEIWLIAR
jgi:hypothetical protein